MNNSSHQKGILLEVGTNEVEFLLFRLGGQAFGINVAKVFQIIIFDPSKVAVLPHQSPEVLGIMDLRGQTITVVDLCMNLGLTATTNVGDTRKLLLISEFNQKRTAFVVDGVDRIERCSWKQFEPVTQNTNVGTRSSVVGTVTLKDGIVVLLDLETIMGAIDPSMGLEKYQDEIQESKGVDRGAVSIVYCEDSPVVQKVLVRTLQSAGFKNLKAFPTGAAGLKHLEALPPGEVDIILSDIEMPQMDGLTLCKNVRANPQMQGVPFVFFSSMISDQMATKCQAVGGNAWYSKPQIHLLVEAIDRLLVESAANKQG